MRSATVGEINEATRVVAKAPFVRDLVAGYYCFLDSSTPMHIKGAIAVPLVYFVMPADMIPDLIPAAGFTDDLAVWIAAMKDFGSYLTGDHYAAADACLTAAPD